MSRGLRYSVATLLAAACAAGLALFSRLPWEADPPDAALLRLSWRAVGERVEECREPTEEELAALPRHMRRERICEGRVTPFRLRVDVDGARALDEEVRGAGARQDRPAYVFEELPLAPGPHRVAVRFEVEGAGDGAKRPPLVLDEEATLAPRGILLVTRDVDTGRLVLRRAGEGGGPG